MTVTLPITPAVPLVEKWVDFYRLAHAQPELSNAEFRTTEMIERALDDLGVEHFRVTPTGCVGVLRNGEGPVIAFRADIDGLPVTEQTGLSYASRTTGEFKGESVGVMHACGHDAHFSALLGAVEHLLAHRDAWSGTLVLIFQPAEEAGSGAEDMVSGGLWEQAPRPEVVLGQHVGPGPGGTVALRAESVLSLSDTTTVTVHGVQSHGSRPDHSVDPVVATAQAIVALQSVVSREVEPGAGVVVTVGTVRAGSAPNIIPESAEFTLNIRTPTPEVREVVITAVHRILDGVAATTRARFEVEEWESFGRCWNDPVETDRVIGALRGAFGEPGVMLLPAPATGSEDVGRLADSIGVPLVYWFFGSLPAEAWADGMPPVNHSPHFAPDATLAMQTGIAGALAVLADYLHR